MRLHQIVLLAALATIPLVALTADAEGPTKKALYTPHPPATLTPGKYILRMRLTSVNGQPFRSTMIRAVPVVIAMKGNTVGFGGKWGPQITGTYGNGVLSASGPTPGGSTFQVTGIGGGGTGQFQMTQDGVKVGGEYLLDPLTTAMPGDTMAPAGSTTGMNGLTPISFGWDINGAPVSSGPASGGTGYSNGYNSSLSRGIGAPGVANDGPNLGGTSVSGWFSDDPSPKTPISKPKPGGGGGGGGSSAGTAKDPKPYVAPGDKPAPAGDSGSFSAWWNSWCVLCGSSGSSSSSSSSTSSSGASGTTSQGDPSNDGSHNAGTSGSYLNFGHLPGSGGEAGGGNKNTGGTNGANGATVNRTGNPGDNPFEVNSSDVLNGSKFVNGASDPVRH